MDRIKPKKGTPWLYISPLVIVVCVMVALRQCSTPGIGNPHEKLAQGDTLNVAIEISPMGLNFKGDTLSGPYYEMMKQMCARHNRPVHFIPFTRVDDALAGLAKGKYHVVIADIPITSELKENFLFVDPVGLDKQVLVQRRDTLTGEIAVPDQVALAGKHITLPKGSAFIPRLRNLAAEIGDTIYVDEDPEYSSEQLIILVALDKLPLTVASEGVARDFLSDYPNLDASVDVSLSQFQSWAVAPSDTALRDTLNLWLRAL